MYFSHLILSPIVPLVPCQNFVGVAVLQELDKARAAVGACEGLKYGKCNALFDFCVSLCTSRCAYICKLRSPLIAFVTEVDGCRGVGRGPRPGAGARGRRHGRRRDVMSVT